MSLNEVKNIAFIVNPISGKGDKEKFYKCVKQINNWKGWEYKILYTERRGHAKELAEQNAEKYNYIFAVGGDGTVHEVAEGLVNSNTIFGIIPMGSGNGIARHLHIPLTVCKSVEMIRKSHAKNISTLLINEKFALGVSGAGFDAHVAHVFDKAETRGLSTYIKLSLKEYLKSNSISVKYRINDDANFISKELFMFTIANSSQWGNDFYISPESKMEDSSVKLLVVDTTNKLQALLLGIALPLKSVLKLPFVTSYDFEKLEFEIVNSTEFHIDGEPENISGIQKVQVLKNSLIVCIPENIESV